MAKGVRVSVEGLREVDAALGQLGKATGRNVMRRVAVARLEPMAEEARRLAPDNPNTRGRDLAKSIAVSTRTNKANFSRAANKAARAGKAEVEAYMGPAGVGKRGAPPQGIWQEFGTVNHPPQPFMRPAWDGGKDALLEGIADDLWAEISKAAARQAKKAARLAAKG
jgi:HK97 gp10 family phage protein